MALKAVFLLGYCLFFKLSSRQAWATCSQTVNRADRLSVSDLRTVWRTVGRPLGGQSVGRLWRSPQVAEPADLRTVGRQSR
jgi:hypothetical protein